MTDATEVVTRLRKEAEAGVAMRWSLNSAAALIESQARELSALRGAAEWLWSEWVKTESEPDPGVYHGSTDHANQVKNYACVGCDAVASSCWPTWVYDFKHAPDCKVAKVRAALAQHKETTNVAG